MVSPETWIQMYSDYKKKLAGQITNNWTKYKVQMPMDWAKVIASRVSSGE